MKAKSGNLSVDIIKTKELGDSVLVSQQYYGNTTQESGYAVDYNQLAKPGERAVLEDNDIYIKDRNSYVQIEKSVEETTTDGVMENAVEGGLKEFTLQGNTNVITDETYKSGLVEGYTELVPDTTKPEYNYRVQGKTIKTNQVIPDNFIKLTLTTTSVPSKNIPDGYITYSVGLESRVGHKVYARLISSDQRLRVCFWKNATEAFDFVTGSLLTESTSSSLLPTEGIFTVTSDMIYNGQYIQLYYYKFANLPAGTYSVTLQLTDLTEIYGAENEPTNLVTLKAQHPELSHVNAYGYRLIGGGEYKSNQIVDYTNITAHRTTIRITNNLMYLTNSVVDNWGGISLNNIPENTHKLLLHLSIKESSILIPEIRYYQHGTSTSVVIQSEENSFLSIVDNTEISGLTYLRVFITGTPKGETVTIENFVIHDLTELGLDHLALDELKSQRPDLFVYQPYHETETRYGIFSSNGTIIPLSAPLNGIGNITDIYDTDTKSERKFGEVDLGDLDWFFNIRAFGHDLFSVPWFGKINNDGSKLITVLSSKYNQKTYEQRLHELNDKDFYVTIASSENPNGVLVFAFDNIGKNVEILKQNLSGVKLVYELATPTSETTEKVILPTGQTFKDSYFTLTSEERTDYPEKRIQGGGEWRGNQLVQNGNFADRSVWIANNKTLAPITISNNRITITNSGDSEQSFYQFTDKPKLNHKYLLCGYITRDQIISSRLFYWSGFTVSYLNKMADVKEFFSIIITNTVERTGQGILGFYTSGKSTTTYEKLMVCDITDLYGEGNEPATVEQFLYDHPEYNNYVEYAPLGTIRNQLITNDGTIIPLSAPIYKIGDVADTVRTNVGESRKFGVVDLGDLTYTRYGTYSNTDRYLTTYFDNKTPNHGLSLCATFQSNSGGYIDVADIVTIGAGINRVSISTSKDKYQSITEFKQAMQGVKLIFELATPTQTLFPSPYKLTPLTSVTDGFKELTLSEIRDEYVKHLENVQKIEYRGKNLNNATVSSGYYYDSSGLPTGTPNARFVRLSEIPVKEKTTYTVSSNLTLYTVWEFSGSNAIIRKASRKITTSQGCNRLRITLYNTSGIADTSAFRYLQLEEGSTATPYEPYFEPTVLEQLDLKSAGTVRDYIEVSNDKVESHRLVGVVEDLGALDWKYNESSKIFYVVGFDFIKIIPSTTLYNAICNNYEIKSRSQIKTEDRGISLHTSDKNYITIYDINFSNVANLVNYLQSTSSKLYYELATPIIEDITQTEIGQKLLSITNHKGTNYITLDNNGNVITTYDKLNVTALQGSVDFMDEVNATQLTNLTQMYSSGYEPSIEDFITKYPEDSNYIESRWEKTGETTGLTYPNVHIPSPIISSNKLTIESRDNLFNPQHLTDYGFTYKNDLYTGTLQMLQEEKALDLDPTKTYFLKFRVKVKNERGATGRALYLYITQNGADKNIWQRLYSEGEDWQQVELSFSNASKLNMFLGNGGLNPVWLENIMLSYKDSAYSPYGKKVEVEGLNLHGIEDHRDEIIVSKRNYDLPTDKRDMKNKVLKKQTILVGSDETKPLSEQVEILNTPIWTDITDTEVGQKLLRLKTLHSDSSIALDNDGDIEVSYYSTDYVVSGPISTSYIDDKLVEAIQAVTDANGQTGKVDYVSRLIDYSQLPANVLITADGTIFKTADNEYFCIKKD